MALALGFDDARVVVAETDDAEAGGEVEQRAADAAAMLYVLSGSNGADLMSISLKPSTSNTCSRYLFRCCL